MEDVVLLDTSVASLLHPKKKDSQERSFYDPHMKGKNLALSFQSVAELHEWAENNRWTKPKRRELDAFIRRFLVIPYDYELAKGWAAVMSASRKDGRRFGAGDCWIAATAVHRQLPLLAHDGHFVGRSIPGLNVISSLERPKAGPN